MGEHYGHAAEAMIRDDQLPAEREKMWETVKQLREVGEVVKNLAPSARVDQPSHARNHSLAVYAHEVRGNRVVFVPGGDTDRPKGIRVMLVADVVDLISERWRVGDGNNEGAIPILIPGDRP